jgi:hypothetical protein
MHSLRDNVSPILINFYVEARILRGDKWLDQDNRLTPKAIQFLDNLQASFKKVKRKAAIVSLGAEGMENIIKYRELFPKGLLPTGSAARQPVKELEERFIWFFNTYPEYDWDTVLEATARYVDDFETRSFEFMRNSGFFIKKQDKQGTTVISDLATWCGLVSEPDMVEQMETSSVRVV